MRWFNVIVPKDSISSFNAFDMEVSLSQTATLLGEVVASGVDIEIGKPETAEVYLSNEEATRRTGPVRTHTADTRGLPSRNMRRTHCSLCE